MALQLGDTAPDFTAPSTDGALSLHAWLGDSWGMVFSHPADFTAVCASELGDVAKRLSAFTSRKTKVVGLSTDPLASHESWKGELEQSYSCEVGFPIVSDESGSVASQYGMLHPKAISPRTARTVCLVDPSKTVRLLLHYPPTLGRDFDEVLRCIDSLQATDAEGVATPAGWRPGQAWIAPPPSKDAAAPSV